MLLRIKELGRQTGQLLYWRLSTRPILLGWRSAFSLNQISRYVGGNLAQSMGRSRNLEMRHSSITVQADHPAFSGCRRGFINWSDERVERGIVALL